MLVMHRLSDLASAGADGSHQVRLAEGLLADDAPTVLGSQSLAEGPMALPKRWRADFGGFETSGAAMLLAAAPSGSPACVTAERSRHRLNSRTTAAPPLSPFGSWQPPR